MGSSAAGPTHPGRQGSNRMTRHGVDLGTLAGGKLIPEWRSGSRIAAFGWQTGRMYPCLNAS